jgi:hypothetical protein
VEQSIRNVYNTLVRKPDGETNMEDLSKNGILILQGNFKIKGGKMGLNHRTAVHTSKL